nr:unnamed protein product [Callosobruchus analis]
MEMGLKGVLNIKRGDIKACLTNLKKYLNVIINKESLTDAELQQKINRIRQSDGEFADIQCQIGSIDENLEDQYAEREIIENNFDSYLALASSVNFKISGLSYTKTIACYLLPTITGVIPNVPINTVELNIPANILLDDPSFCEPCGIDILIGAELFWELLLNNEIRLGKRLSILHKTKLGYIISGPITLARNRVNTSLCCLATHTDVQTQLSKFWEVEEVDCKQALLKEQELCETHFLNTTTRDIDGRFIVKIPLKGDIFSLGNSRRVAESRLVNLEGRLQENDVLKTLYVDFMNEYQSLENNIETPAIYYLPHHGVLTENSLTTLFRVVFDSSMPSSTSYSLNHLQMIGPNVQDGLISILLRFRFHKVVLSVDISKMYRQVLIAPEQSDLQRILGREDSSKLLQTYI